jgi:hypothetical protein
MLRVIQGVTEVVIAQRCCAPHAVVGAGVRDHGDLIRPCVVGSEFPKPTSQPLAVDSSQLPNPAAHESNTHAAALGVGPTAASTRQVPCAFGKAAVQLFPHAKLFPHAPHAESKMSLVCSQTAAACNAALDVSLPLGVALVPHSAQPSQMHTVIIYVHPTV